MQTSQVTESAHLLSKCFVEYNKSINANPDVIADDFGDPNALDIVAGVTG